MKYSYELDGKNELERKSLYLGELLGNLELSKTNKLVDEYFNVIWEFTGEFKYEFGIINYCNNKIRAFLESLTNKSDIYYLEGVKLNWTLLYNEFEELNSLLVKINGIPEEIDGKLKQFNIIEDKKNIEDKKEDRDFIFYIKDYDLLQRIFLFYFNKTEEFLK